MHVQFRYAKLEDLATERKGAKKYPPEVVERFFEVFAILTSITEEKELYAFKGLRYHSLRGDLKGQSAVWLNNQWRLTLTIQEDEEGQFIEIIAIEDYH